MARNQTPQKASWDLLLKGGHVLDPARNLDGPADIAMAGGKIAAVGTGLPRAKAKEVRNVAGRLLTPGLIDLHTHVYWGGASCGVDADRIARRSATTTSVDAGTTGAGNFRGFRHHVIERSDSRILAFINLSFPGIFGFAHDLDIGEAKDLSYLNRKHCIEMAEANADLIVGIKIRMGVVTTGQLGMKPLARAKAAAAAIGKPIMAHISKGPPAYGEVLKALRPGDILTHCFRPAPNGPVTPSGTINRELLRARDRGVIMDIGHGKGSFGFTAARRLLDAGIMPDVISSDVHSLSLNGPAFDVLVTMSKLLAMGMPLTEVVRAATETPAAVIGRPELGTLSIGSPADVAVLELAKGRFNFRDANNEALAARQRLIARGVVIAGRWWSDGEDDPSGRGLDPFPLTMPAVPRLALDRRRQSGAPPVF